MQASHSDSRRRETREWIRFALFALALASLFFFGYLWRWLHVSIAVPPSSAPSAKDIDSIAVGLACRGASEIITPVDLPRSERASGPDC
jgi:hypothetical protein